MAAHTKLAIVLFLFAFPTALASSVAAPTVPETTPSSEVLCTWTTVNQELDCNGKTFIYEAQDAIGSARWWFDMAIVGILIVFAGTLPKRSSSPSHYSHILCSCVAW